MNSRDCFTQSRRNAELRELRGDVISFERDRIGDNNLFNRRFFKSLDCGAGKYAVSRTNINFFSTLFFKKSCCAANRAGSVNKVVEKHADFAFYVADYVFSDGFVVFVASFIDNCERTVEFFCKMSCSCYPACVRAYCNEFFRGNIQFFYVFCQNRGCKNVINENVEESLNLSCVQIHRQNSVYAGCGQKVGNEFRCDSFSSGGFSVLSCVAVIRDYSGDGFCAGAFECVNND